MNEIFAANFITYAPDSWMEASEYASEAINRVKTTTIPGATPFAAGTIDSGYRRIAAQVISASGSHDTRGAAYGSAQRDQPPDPARAH